MFRRRGSLALTPPTLPIFAIAVVLGGLAALMRYKVVSIAALSGYTFEMMLAAFLLLVAGAVLRGL